MIDVFDLKPVSETFPSNPIRIVIPTSSMQSVNFQTCLKHINNAHLPEGSIVTVVISSGPDFSFSKSINAGLARVKNEDILLLNDDCFIDQETMKNLENSIKPNDGIVGGVLRYENGLIQHFGGILKTSFLSIFVADTKNKAPLYSIKSYHIARRSGIRYVRTFHYRKEPAGPVDYVTGAFFFIRHEVFQRVGMLDESLVNDWEDLDYCLRAKKLGYEIRVEKSATAIHQEHASLKGVKADFFEKLKVFTEKWNEKDLSEVLGR